MVFKMSFHESTQCFDMGFGAIETITTTDKLDDYKGEYEVTPTAEGLILETKQKYMREDLVIKEIPYAEVANNAGGTTVTIG